MRINTSSLYGLESNISIIIQQITHQHHHNITTNNKTTSLPHTNSLLSFSTNQPTAFLKMQYSALVIALAAAAAPLASAFSVTNCETGEYKNFGSGSNFKCHGFNLGSSTTFDSKRGYNVRVFRDGNCNGESFLLTAQNQCVSVPFRGLSATAERA